MANPNVRIKRSGVSNKRPTLSDLNLGELGLNFYDGYLFAQRDTGGVGIGTTIALLTPWTENFGGTSIYYGNSVGIGTTNPNVAIKASNNATIAAGIVTANYFYGDGSNLTGVVATGSGVSVEDDSSSVGTASTLNFGQNLTVSLSGGVATINGAGSPWVETSAGIHTLSSIGIGTTNATSLLQVGSVGASGTSLSVNGDVSIVGVVSVTSLQGQISITNSGNLNATRNVVLSTTTSGNSPLIGDLDLTYNTITNILTAGSFSGSGGLLTNLNASNISSGTLGTSRLSGTYDINISGIATYATLSGISTSVIGGIASVSQLNVSGVSTITDIRTNININSSGIHTAQQFVGNINAGVGTITNITGTNLNYTGVSTITNIRTITGINASGIITAQQFVGNINAGVGTITNITGTNLNYTGVSTITDIRTNTNINSSGIHTALGGFVGNLTGTATTATKLATARTFEITGDVIASAISFDGSGNVSLAATIQPNSVGLGTDTFGDYVETISGTSNQITVTSGTGERSTPTLSLPTKLIVPQDLTVTRDLQVNRNLNVTGIHTALGGFNIGIQSGGVSITTGVITAINFVGTGNTFSYDSSSKIVSAFISGSGSGIGTQWVTNSVGLHTLSNVGIGTTNPTSKLQIQGNTNINNTLPTTVSYAASFTVLGQETEPREVSFSNDGGTMYVLGNTGNDITWYTLSTPWSVTTASFVSQFSVASQITAPLGLTFKPDGTKFYIVGATGTVGAGATSVSEYSCTTPWDLTTAGFTTAFSVISEDSAPNDIEFSTDGTKFYVLGDTNNAIFQYTCTTPWSIASGVSVGPSFSVSSQEATPQGFAFSNDGTKLLLTGSNGDDINYYTLSTPWNIATASFVGIITAVGTGILGETGPSGLYWKPDGKKLYLSGTSLDRVYEFNMTSDAQLEVAGKTLLYGDAEVHQDLNVYGKSYFGNNVGIGITNPTTKLHVNGDILSTGSVTSTSDENLKVNVQTITNALSKVLSLRGVEYDRIDTKDHQIGVIAQEVEKIVPEVVYPKTEGINLESKSVSYGNLVGLLIEAIKEQQAQIDELNQKLLNR
jgi:hypothetical protein